MTKKLFWAHPYEKEFETTVIAVKKESIRSCVLNLFNFCYEVIIQNSLCQHIKRNRIYLKEFNLML